MGLDQISYGLIMQEIERCDSGLRSLCSVQGSLVMYPIWKYGSEEQKMKWLPDMAAGKKIGCFGLTEPDHGSNPGGMVTTFQDKGRPLPAERCQDVDQQQPIGRCGRGLGQGREHRRTHPRIAGGARHGRFHHAHHAR